MAIKRDSKATRQSEGETWIEPLTSMEFVWVPGGTFQLGITEERPVFEDHPNEESAHEVRVDGFWLGKYPVTQGEWKTIMGNNPSHFKGERNPVERVSWNDAQRFLSKLNQCSHASFRLPSEAEWEYAARSCGRWEKYSGGDDLDSVAWYKDNSDGKTHPVGEKAPNNIGIYDMSGNVCEWCEDEWHLDFKSAPSAEHSFFALESLRVHRGGSWRHPSWGTQSTLPLRTSPDEKSKDLGFRLLKEIND